MNWVIVMLRTVSIGTLLLALLLSGAASPVYAQQGPKEEPGMWKTFKRKVLSALNWEENVERAGDQVEKTKKNLIEKNKDGGYRKSIKNIEESISRSSENAQKVFKKNVDRLSGDDSGKK